jgi:hypothetical protein
MAERRGRVETLVQIVLTKRLIELGNNVRISPPQPDLSTKPRSVVKMPATVAGPGADVARTGYCSAAWRLTILGEIDPSGMSSSGSS